MKHFLAALALAASPAAAAPVTYEVLSDGPLFYLAGEVTFDPAANVIDAAWEPLVWAPRHPDIQGWMPDQFGYSVDVINRRLFIGEVDEITWSYQGHDHGSVYLANEAFDADVPDFMAAFRYEIDGTLIATDQLVPTTGRRLASVERLFPDNTRPPMFGLDYPINVAEPPIDPTISPVPVPAALPLLLVGMGALGFLRFRRT